MVFYMGIKNAPKIQAGLIAHGMSPTTPAAIIEKGTRIDQKVTVTTLGQLSETVSSNAIKPPALLVVGEVIRVREQLLAKSMTSECRHERSSVSEYLRILGKGPKSRRSLTQAEAASALKMILSGQVTEKQLGAFLLLMRANGESPQELIGFVKGLRSALGLSGQSCRLDLDWAAYAGKWRYPPYFLLSVKLLNQMGYRVLLHGDSGQFDNRQYASAFLAELNFYPAESLVDAAEAIEQGTLTYLPLEPMLLHYGRFCI